jgi:predicted AlkP superfamily phosphohydrolase/phosphomutase
MTSSFRKVPALWNIVSESGRRVCVVNWNPAYPAEAINGIFIAHGISPKKKGDEMIYPHEWRNRIRALTPVRFNKIESSLNALKGSQAWRAYDLDRFVYTVSKEILVSEQPDLMMVYFPGTDIVSHLYWKYRWPMSMKHFFQITFEERHKLSRTTMNLPMHLSGDY